MIITISPSKGQDFNCEVTSEIHTIPDCLEHTSVLHKELSKLSVDEIKNLMSVSDNIAKLNFSRFKDFTTPFTKNNSKPALFAFKGDVYSGFSKHEYTDADLEYAQKHLRILSGFYGALRPMDLIQAYRLEMKTKLASPKGDNLYQFWGDIITNRLNKEFEAHDNKILLNLASGEYFKSINIKALQANIVNVIFKEIKDERSKIIAIFAKKARGLMSDYILRNRIDDLEGVKQFNIAGYSFDDKESDGDNLVFSRIQPTKK